MVLRVPWLPLFSVRVERRSRDDDGRGHGHGRMRGRPERAIMAPVVERDKRVARVV
jgi:hypothetical protein